MTQVSRKGFVDKNGQKVVIVPKVPGATSGNLASFDAEGNLQDSGLAAGDVNNIHTIEYEDGSYESRMGVGKLNRDDDELDGASIYGKDAIRLGVSGGRVFIDASNVANLEDALASAKIPLWDNGVIPFEASNGSLVLVSDTSEYDSLFTNVPQIGAGKIYYSTRIIVDDTAVFLAICEAETKTGGYLEFENKKVVTMFVGGYTLVIQKGVTSGTVTLKTVSSLDAVLSASVESTSQAES